MEAHLPPLREDIQLLKRGVSRSGAPIWTLYDSMAHKFFRIGWIEFEVLSRWHLGEVDAILGSIARETTIRPLRQDIMVLFQFLVKNQLVKTAGAYTTASLMKEHERTKGHIGTWLLKNYLFMRIPLVRPDAALATITAQIRFLFSLNTVYIVVATALLGAFLVWRDLDSFFSGFRVMQTPAGAAGVMCTVIFAKICHEMGHALTAKYFNCRVPVMGIAFIVMWPLLWTDTTDAWRLTNRRQRMAIDAAGMIAELALAAAATIAWVLLPDGNIRMCAHLLASTTWIMTLLINLNPLMRFDGYYIFADMLDVPNVQERAFALVRWWLRKFLWSFPDAPPEIYPPRLRRIMICYAIACMIYRVSLFFGIALVVYHFFFKILGCFLFAVEIWWFILRPIIQEFRIWKQRMSEIRLQRRTSLMLVIVLAALVLSFLPVTHHVSAPAMLRMANEVPLTSPHAGKLVMVNVQSGQTVAAGQVLFTIMAPDVEYDVKKANLEQIVYTQQNQQNAMDRKHYRSATIASMKSDKSTAATLAHEVEREQLVIKAPADGRIVDIPNTLTAGNWLASNEPLGLFVNGEVRAEAFVTETDVNLLQEGSRAYFIGADGARYQFTVLSVGNTAIKQVPYPEMASIFQGPISVQTGNHQKEALLPEHKLYRVLLHADPAAFPSLPQSYRGTMHINAQWSSLLWPIISKTIGIVIREIGG